MRHVKFRDGLDRVINGCHDAKEFAKIRQVNAVANPNYKVAIGKTLDQVEEIIIKGRRNGNTPGVQIIEYQIPAINREGKTTGELVSKIETKSIYDPNIWPDHELEKALKEALQDHVNKNNGKILIGNPQQGYTTSKHLIKFTTQIGNKVTSFWFN